MVTITDTKISESSEGRKFVSLKIQGEPELVQSHSGRFYATCNTCWITSTFDIQTAKSLIGRQLPGTVVREVSSPYEFTNEAGEVITLHHRCVYQPEPDPIEPFEESEYAETEEFDLERELKS